jgi:methane/ammonia monooxygenase subunit C
MKNIVERLPKREDGLPKIPYFNMLINMVVGMIFFLGYRMYINYHSLTVGLDYFEPEFHLYYMNLLYIQLTSIAIFGLAIVSWIWFTRPKEINMPPSVELSWYFLMFSIFAISGVFSIIILGIYTEADAAWHQITVRDTDFTPTHIALFYMAIPIGLVALVSGGLWVHTRLPDFRNRISIPLVITVAAPILIMPNLGFNEWGHTFFYAEELFAAPIHWGFVVLGWGLFGIAGFLMQCIARIKVLTDLSVQDGEQVS